MLYWEESMLGVTESVMQCLAVLDLMELKCQEIAPLASRVEAQGGNGVKWGDGSVYHKGMRVF